MQARRLHRGYLIDAREAGDFYMNDSTLNHLDPSIFSSPKHSYPERTIMHLLQLSGILVVALTPIVSTSPTSRMLESNSRSFSVEQIPAGYKLKHGATEILKAFPKYGKVPTAGVVAAARGSRLRNG